MRYLLLVWVDEEAEAAELPPGTIETWMDDVQGSGIRLVGGALDAPARSTLVRERGGELLVTDGPFAESKEWIGGFDLLECDSLDEALGVARRHPMVALGSIELRPIVSLGIPSEERVVASDGVKA
ncbi:YciI family protein [Microbacterium ulmi]|uniref:YCII-related domain-containing protein n=1 Tax=Microbacterium ulmi TaxID=179095 RepID=A0A7Y2LZA5_9MICO|nr:YciI family protein [Microbacterium ulmi]NII68721.1 hypothetical protein [Microbacterium ulmi]NNH03616.1 hypothetical protein [Microbacterium ulmi]